MRRRKHGRHLLGRPREDDGKRFSGGRTRRAVALVRGEAVGIRDDVAVR